MSHFALNPPYVIPHSLSYFPCLSFFNSPNIFFLVMGVGGLISCKGLFFFERSDVGGYVWSRLLQRGPSAGGSIE